MAALLSGGGQQQQKQNPLAVGPGESAGLIEAMNRDAGMGGVGFTPGANAGGTGFPQPTGSPTPDLQYDMAGIAAGAANQGQLTLDQLAMLQGNQSTAGAASQGFSNAFNQNQNTTGSDANSLGTSAGSPTLT